MSRLLGLVLVSWFATAACAVNWLNTNANNQWEDDANWSGGAQPTSTDAVIIGLDGANKAILSQAGEQGQDVLVGSGTAGELQMTGGDLAARKLLIGDGVSGTFDQDNGAVTLTEDLLVGTSGGSGEWNIAGGTVSARKVLAGLSNSSTTGVINQSGGTVTTVENYMTGDNGIGTLHMTGGTIHAGLADERALILGLGGALGSSNTTIEGTAELYANDVVVGDNAQGTNALTVSGTGKLFGGRQGAAVRIAANNSVTATVVVKDSGEINVGTDPLNGLVGPLVVGVNGLAASTSDATLTIQDNGIVRARILLIGDRQDAKGKVVVEGGLLDVSEEFFVGAPGGGKAGVVADLEVSGGQVNARNLLLTDNANQLGSATLTGGLVNLSSNFFVSDANLGQGLLTIDGLGTLINAANLVVDNNGEVIHRMGDVVLSGAMVIEADRNAGFGRGSYDLQMGSITMGGDRIALMNSYIADGLLFSTNPLFSSFSLAFDGSQTTLSVNKIPEPATLTLFVIAACSLWGVRRRAISDNFR